MVIGRLLIFQQFIHCANISFLSISIDLAWEHLVEEAEVPAKSTTTYLLSTCYDGPQCALSVFHGASCYHYPFSPFIMVPRFQLCFNCYTFPSLLESTFLWGDGRMLGCHSKAENAVNAEKHSTHSES